MKRDYNRVEAIVMDYSWDIFCDYYNEVNCNMDSIHYRTSDGYEEWREYDDCGRIIRYRNSYGDIHQNTYDDKKSTKTVLINQNGKEYYYTHNIHTGALVSLSSIN